MTTAAPALMTTEERLALPDNGVERWLIRGRLREKTPRYKDRDHGVTLAHLGRFLCTWSDDQLRPVGDVLVCAGCRLRHDPATTIGVDVAYVLHDVPCDAAQLVDGAPVLAAEILSPNESMQEIDEKIDEYLAAGVRLVWVIDPHDRTVTIHRPGREPAFVNATQELSGDPELPGFHVAVARLFA